MRGVEGAGRDTRSSPTPQQRKIAALVKGKNPDRLALPGFLWTRALVRNLIRRELGLEVGEDTIGRYLRAWCMSPQ